MTSRTIDDLAGPPASVIRTAMKALATSLYLPDIAAAVNLAVTTGHPALLGAACRAIDRVVAVPPTGDPAEMLALLTAATALDATLDRQPATPARHAAGHGSLR